MSGLCDFCQIWHSGSCCHPGRQLLAAAERAHAESETVHRDLARKYAQDAAAEIAALKQRLEQSEKLLRPFSNAARRVSEGTPDAAPLATHPSPDSDMLWKATAGDLRRAAAYFTALAAEPPVRSQAPEYQAFWQKYALGPLSAPSCLVCGQTVLGAMGMENGPSIQHAELPGIVVCKSCHNNQAEIAAEPPVSQAQEQGDG